MKWGISNNHLTSHSHRDSDGSSDASTRTGYGTRSSVIPASLRLPFARCEVRDAVWSRAVDGIIGAMTGPEGDL
jgi:hypothetical protein